LIAAAWRVLVHRRDDADAFGSRLPATFQTTASAGAVQGVAFTAHVRS